MCSDLHVILHLSAKFLSNRTNSGSYDVISIFRDGHHRVGNLLPGLDLVTTPI